MGQSVVDERLTGTQHVSPHSYIEDK